MPKLNIEILVMERTMIAQELIELILIVFRQLDLILSLSSKSIRSKTWAKWSAITVIRKITILIPVSSQKTSIGLNEFLVNDYC